MQDRAIDISGNRETSIRREVCIYKVPTSIRNVNETAYTPRVVSIGLIHKDNRDKGMELLKERYLTEFYNRLNTEVKLDDFRGELVTIVSQEKQNILDCYEDPNIPQDGEAELVKMILLDAVFIMELFLRNYEQQLYENDLIIRRPRLSADVQHDLLLLENQLPFKFLNYLYDFLLSKFAVEDYCELSFLELTCSYFATGLSRLSPRAITRVITNLQGVNVLHFTDVVRYFWLVDNPKYPSLDSSQIKICIPSVTDLHDQAGVEFEFSESKRLLNVVFEEKKYLLWKVGKLIMPCIIIDDSAEVIIRNVMALEQRYYPGKAYVCSYIILLGYLLRTVEDVNLLVEAKIIINHLDDNALVVKKINELCYKVDVGVNYYHYLFQRLNHFYHSKYLKDLATLKRVYFKDTWTSTATITGVFVVVLQIVQTFSSIWQIAHGSK